MDPYKLFVLQMCLALFLCAASVVLVLVVGVKVGEYLEARRQIKHMLAEKRELPNKKYLEALKADQDDEGHFMKWEMFYDELR